MTRHSLRLKLLALGLAGAALLGACGDDDDDTGVIEDGDSATTLAQTTTTEGDSGDGVAADAITIEGFSYSAATVEPGATVSIENKDSAPHTVTANEGEAFDSGEISGGGTGSITAPSEPGTYEYHCNVHSSMSGTLTVEG
jgi:plastocyanin